MTTSVLEWAVFSTILVTLLWIDLRILNRETHAVTLAQAAVWSAVWVLVSIGFGAWVWVLEGADQGLKFFTGYVVEKSLSVDNMFVFILIFSYFRIPAQYQPRVLKWGVLGALVMRFLIILLGVALLEAFHWVLYIFGGLLLITGYKVAFADEHSVRPDRNIVIRLLRRCVPVDDRPISGSAFFTRRDGRRCVTTMFITLVSVEVSDLIFAVDSVPAVLAITTDPFIVYTSNAFAILGLRALYFLLQGMTEIFRDLKFGIAVVLCLVGVKMLLADVYHIPTIVSLGGILLVLTVSVLSSLVRAPRRGGPHRHV